jgi:hypothetical protein
MGRLSEKQELKSYMKYDIFFARFTTSVQAVKFKCKGRQMKHQKTLIAHLLSDCLKLPLYHQVDVSRFIFRTSY